MSTPATSMPDGGEDQQLDDLLERLSAVTEQIGKVIVGQHEPVRMMQVALLAGGHCLLQGVPGVAKTLMAKTLADALSLSFKRVQFTPDLMPSDVIGTEVLQQTDDGRRRFEFQPGPVFANLLLADEINRAPPKTQASLLEAMAEREVTYGGETHMLPAPFMVLATQNPIEQAGTYPLPEAELDRFLLLVEVAYPSASDEIEVLRRTTGADHAEVEASLTDLEIEQLKMRVRQVHCDEEILLMTSRLVRGTRPSSESSELVREFVRWGAGPRAGQGLVLAAKASALLQGRYAVTPSDIRSIANSVLRHRIHLNYRAESEGIEINEVIDQTLQTHLPE